MRRHIDYAFKSKVLRENEKLIEEYKKADLETYKEKQQYFIDIQEDNGIVWSKNHQTPLDDLYVECCLNGQMREYNEIGKIIHAYYERVKRLKNKVYEIIKDGKSLFLTLTFNDDTLNTTTEKQRRVLVARYLKKQNAQYVANIDFGKKNHREHYHAIIKSNKINLEDWHKNGAIDIEHVRIKEFESDTKKISKYIAKLANHAIKETTKRNALMYSR